MAKYKPGTHDATFMFSDNFGEAVFRFPLYQTYSALVQPILEQVRFASAVGALMSRLVVLIDVDSVGHHDTCNSG